MNFSDYIKVYETKTINSKRLYNKSTKLFPGGISHNIRYYEPYPIYVNKASGRFLFDVDSNKYTDYWMGHWALILGHSHRDVVKALEAQIPNGTLYGTVNDVSIQLAEEVQKLMPRAEMLRFSSTGSEATMYAVRLARAKTGRRVIAKAVGGWHGFNTTLMQSVNFPFESEEGQGLVQDEEQFVESIPFNDLDRSLKVLESIKDDLACIIIEPILGGAGCITPVEGYLKGLQEFAKRNDSIFILDEIVTGFRVSIRGAADYYDLEPDLFTLGKIVGGGMPIGVVCGNKEILSLADPVSIKDKEARCAIGGGTFSANPITMTAGLATIKHLKQNRSQIYNHIDKMGKNIRKGLGKIFNDAKIPVEITGIGSLFMPHFLDNNVTKITNALDVAQSNKDLLKRFHISLMAKHGIFFLPMKMGAVSSAHTEADINKLLNATQRIVDSGILNKPNSTQKTG